MQTDVLTIPSGFVQGEFINHDLDRFATITDSTALHGFVFLGNKPLDLDTSKCKHLSYIPNEECKPMLISPQQRSQDMFQGSRETS